MDFHPKNAPVPKELRTARFFLRPLLASDVEIDYEAVMASREQLRRWSQSTWPADDFTLEENLDDLERHAREHRDGEAFTYTVLHPEGKRCLGCVYITPVPQVCQPFLPHDSYGANVGFWVRSAEIKNDLDRALLADLIGWFDEAWAFDQVVFVISQQEMRQAEILERAGTVRKAAVELSDGRPCWLNVRPADGMHQGE
jgi:hypothetical protein